MPSEKIMRAVEDASITTDKIKIKTTNPELKDKIRLNVVSEEPVFWYIRFNIPLDEKSVSKKTMNVTETNGYIVDTEISYDSDKHMIIIVPVDDYEDDQYYLLNITKKVKSSKGQNLKREIHIMFKILGNQIQEYKVLKSNVKVPKSKPRPKNWRIVPQKQRDETVSKFYSPDTLQKLNKTPLDRLPYGNIKFNFVVALIGVIATAAGIILANQIIMLIGITVSVLGIIHIITQLLKPGNRSALVYNRGVIKFNRGDYKPASEFFERACKIDGNNELSEYAVNKIKFYLQ